MLEIDEISNLVKVDADLRIKEIEKRLNAQGYTLGYFTPPSGEVILEEVLGHRLPNLYASMYGEITDLCASLSLETKDKTFIHTWLAPRHATGPDWKKLILGTDRKWGLIYQAVLKIFKKPSHVLFSILGVASEGASYLMEQQMTRLELIPRCFGRFSRAEIKRNRAPLQGDYFLVLEWAGSKKNIDATLKVLEGLLGREISHTFISSERAKAGLSSILRHRLPDIPWGGIKPSISDLRAAEVEKEILEALKK